MSEILKSFVDKGREDNVTDTSEMSFVEYQVEQAPAAFRDWPHCLVIPYIAEIRRLRAENAELNNKITRFALDMECVGCDPVCYSCSQEMADLAKERTPLP